MKIARADIQGLRALAVLLVIADHFLGRPSGGFIGVDVFFVISGFLITGHLIREQEQTGRISFRRFYARRVRRILPAALTVTLVTVAAGFVAFTNARAQSIAEDGIWAALFSANWRFILVGTDYMHADDALSPLQHYWSLSIEEQFYFVWPFVMVGCAWIALRRGRRSARQASIVAIAVIVAASFAWAMFETAAQPTWAYFSTFSRAWELGVGALLALATPALMRLPSAARPIIAWAGLATIGVSAVLVGPDTPFPGPWAAPAVLGTAAAIAAGTAGPVRFLWPLTNKLVGYIGNISYSLYLWHWPVFVFVSAFLPNSPRRMLLVSLALTGLLSIASYHLIENPLRTAHAVRDFAKPSIAIVAVAAVLVVTAAAVPRQTASVEVVQVRTEYPEGALGDAYRDIDEALLATEWPSLSPSIDSIGPEDRAPEWVEDGCLASGEKSLAEESAKARLCTYGSGEKTAVLIGDSVAISWMPGLRSALPDYTIHVFTMQSCAAVPMDVDFEDIDEEACQAFRDWYMREVETMHPNLLIASNVFWQLQRTDPESTATWQDRARSLYSRMSQLADHAVVLQSNPAARGFDNCAGPSTTPASCLLFFPRAYGEMEKQDRIAIEGTGTTYIPTRYWFCNPQNQCPAFQEDIPVIVDASHLSARFSEHLGPVIAEALPTAD